MPADVPQQVLDRNRALQRLELERILAGFIGQIDADFCVGKAGMYFETWDRRGQLSVIDQHHRGNRGDGLRHRTDREDRVRCHRQFGRDILHAEAEQTGCRAAGPRTAPPGIFGRDLVADVVADPVKGRAWETCRDRCLGFDRSSYGQPVTSKAASAATIKRRRPAACLVFHRFIDQLLEGPLDALAFRRRLLKQHEEHVLLAVDHHAAAGGAVPFQFASAIPAAAAWCYRDRYARQIPVPKPSPGEIEIVPLNAGALTDMVRCHQLERLLAEIGLASKVPPLSSICAACENPPWSKPCRRWRISLLANLGPCTGGRHENHCHSAAAGRAVAASPVR